MGINRMSIRAQRVNITEYAVGGCWHHLIPLPVLELITLQYRLFVQQSYKRAQHQRQFKFQLFYWNLGGETEHFDTSDISSILLVLMLSWEPWAKQAAGGGVGWETLLRASWTIVFCQQRTEWENHPAGGERSRKRYRSVARRSAPLQMVAAASCWTATHEARLLSVSLSPSSVFLFVWLGI